MRIILLTLPIYELFMHEAITTGMIKIIQVDEHDQSVWNNVAESNTLEGPNYMNYISLPEIVTFRAVRGALIIRQQIPRSKTEGFGTQNYFLNPPLCLIFPLNQPRETPNLKAESVLSEQKAARSRKPKEEVKYIGPQMLGATFAIGHFCKTFQFTNSLNIIHLENLA